MIPLETKQSGGKLLPHSHLRGGVFLGEASRSIQREMKIGTWNIRSLYRAGSLMAAAIDWTGLGQDRDRWRTLVSAVMNLRVL